MSEAKGKATLKDVVSVLIIFSIIGILAYGISTKQIQYKGEIDVGTLEGFLLGVAASAVVKWLFGE